MSEIRKDPLTGRAVIIAPERAQRPRQIGSNHELAAPDACPFCPGNENLTPPELWADRPDHSAANRPGWSVRVVANKFPAVSIAYGSGEHEVVIETPAHVENLAILDAEQYNRIFLAYRERLRALQSDRHWRFALIFKNQGERAGATFEHVHSQIIALPFLVTGVENDLAATRDYHRRNNECYFCNLIDREIQAKARVVAHNDHFITLCPIAPRFAFETWILPRVHAPAFIESDDATIAALARTAQKTIAALNRIQVNPPFNYFIQSPALDETDRAHYHWQWRLLPQFCRAAGFEWGAGIHINPVTPENAASLLRDAMI